MTEPSIAALDRRENGIKLVRSGDTMAGLQHLLEALELDVGNLALLHDVAHVYLRLGQVVEAGQCYRRILAMDASDGYAREMLSQGLQEQWMSVLGQTRIGREASKSHAARIYSGFYRCWLSGRDVLDIGFRGGLGEAEPVVPQATGIDLGYPGYDGVYLPFSDGSQDSIYSSHCLEHMNEPEAVIKEWFRVLRVGGYLVTVVPHQYLYERRLELPSAHPDHLRFFTPSSLLALFELAMPVNYFRVRHLQDNDLFYDYSVWPDKHPVGCYEIELVLEKIKPPTWSLA